jgi:LCP family protein required for cell wall assembly
VSRRRDTSLRIFWGRFAVAFALCLVLTAGAIGGAYWFANNEWDAVADANIQDDVFADEPDDGEPANFLIIGSDSREFVDDVLDAEQFGDPSVETGQRSDTMMIAHVDPETDTGMIVSFPRDLWVNVPGRGQDKLNAAFNRGPQNVIETLKSNFEIPIHHYLEVDFAGFQELVDAVGGVPIRFPTPARDEYTGLQILLPGCKEMNGRDALAYVRSRHYEYQTSDGDWQVDGRADLGRIARQQYFIRSLAAVAIETASNHPLRASSILTKAFGSLTKDRDLGLSDLRALASTWRETDPEQLEMLTIPATPDEIDGRSVLLVDHAKAAPILERLRAFGPEQEPLPVPPDLVPAEVRVKVLNGSGVDGEASAVMEDLADAGFQRVDPPANADSSDYEETVVRFGAGNRAKAQLVAAYLGTRNLSGRRNVRGADVTVVIGSDFDEVRTPITIPPTTTTVASPETTAPEANPGETAPAAPRPVVGC